MGHVAINKEVVVNMDMHRPDMHDHRGDIGLLSEKAQRITECSRNDAGHLELFRTW